MNDVQQLAVGSMLQSIVDNYIYQIIEINHGYYKCKQLFSITATSTEISNQVFEIKDYQIKLTPNWARTNLLYIPINLKQLEENAKHVLKNIELLAFK